MAMRRLELNSIEKTVIREEDKHEQDCVDEFEEVFAEEGEFVDTENRVDNRDDCWYGEDVGRFRQGDLRRWNDLFAGNRRAENGVAIGFTAPLSREVLDFTVDDMSEVIDYWKFALIRMVIGAKIPIDAMTRFVASRWNLQPKIHVANSGVFVFRFNSEDDQLSVFGGGPWMVKGVHPLVLK